MTVDVTFDRTAAVTAGVTFGVKPLLVIGHLISNVVEYYQEPCCEYTEDGICVCVQVYY